VLLWAPTQAAKVAARARILVNCILYIVRQ
jgi:hypothetical protein